MSIEHSFSGAARIDYDPTNVIWGIKQRSALTDCVLEGDYSTMYVMAVSRGRLVVGTDDTSNISQLARVGSDRRYSGLATAVSELTVRPVNQ